MCKLAAAEVALASRSVSSLRIEGAARRLNHDAGFGEARGDRRLMQSSGERNIRLN